MNTKILLINPMNELHNKVKSLFHNIALFDVTEVSAINKAQEHLIKERPDLIVVNMGQLSKRVFDAVDTIRRPFDLKVIGITRKMSINDHIFVKNKTSYSFVEEPLNRKELLGISYKMLKDIPTPQQTSRRYDTQQKTNLQLLPNGTEVPAFITNLSVSGARITSDLGFIPEEGTIVRLDVELAELQKSHNLHGKVVWQKPSEQKGSKEFGIRFISNEEVYQHLLVDM
ncbi:MAG: PilZ domain-containing protein [Bdellovibrionales bacterium]